MITVGQRIGYYWHGVLRHGFVTKLDGNSITVRDTMDF